MNYNWISNIEVKEKSKYLFTKWNYISKTSKKEGHENIIIFHVLRLTLLQSVRSKSKKISFCFATEGARSALFNFLL